MTTGHHTDDDFAYSQRLIDEQRGTRRPILSGTATATVTKAPVHHFGKQTLDAIKGETAQMANGSSITFTGVDPIGPTDWYTKTGPLQMGAADLLYRPNDTIRLEVQGKASSQVGGTHYGDPKTDVYAFALANDLDALQFNVVKYVTRFRKKDGIKDLRKAIHTLERLIAHEESK